MTYLLVNISLSTIFIFFSVANQMLGVFPTEGQSHCEINFDCNFSILWFFEHQPSYHLGLVCTEGIGNFDRSSKEDEDAHTNKIAITRAGRIKDIDLFKK